MINFENLNFLVSRLKKKIDELAGINTFEERLSDDAEVREVREAAREFGQ